MSREVTEYVITFKDDTDEYIFEDKEEADTAFAELPKKNIHQYYAKTWVWAGNDYQEDDVEVYYND